MAGLPGPLVYCRRNRAAVAPLFGCTAAAVALLVILSVLAGAIHEAKSQLRRHYWTFSVVQLADPEQTVPIRQELTAAVVGLLVPARRLPLPVSLPLGRDTAQVYLVAEPGWRALDIDRPPAPGQVLLHRSLLQAARLQAGDVLPSPSGFPRLTVAGELGGKLKIGLGPLPDAAPPNVFLVFPQGGQLAALERFLRELEQRHRGALTVLTREQVGRELAAETRFLGAITGIILWLAFLVSAILAAAATWVATRSRAAEFAILAVLGFSSREVTGVLLLESLVVSGAGMAAGIAAGLAGLLLFWPLLARSGVDPFLPPGLVVKVVLLPLVLTLVAGVTSHSVLCRVDPVKVIERAGDVTGQ